VSADERLHARVMVVPALLAMGFVTAYPVAMALWLSTRRRVLVFGEDAPVGLDNVAFLLSDARFWSALGNTAYFTGAAVSLELALGLAFAVLLDRKVPGEGLLRASVLIPWALPTVVSARMWSWLLHPHHGALGRLLPGEGDILGSPTGAMHAAIAIDVWKTTPFVALLLLAGLKTIPEEVRRAAAIDGATGLRAFLRIDLPLLRSTIVVAALLRALDAFRVFDAIWVLTEGGPANTTESLSIYAYKTLMRAGDFGYGSTLAMATLFCVAALAVGWLRLLRPREVTR
jgi:multiple sugar transport system permease protein